MGLFVAVLIVLVVLIYFMLVMIRSVVNEVTHKVDSYFQENLQEYDTNYKEKIARMNQMHKDVEELSAEMRSMQNELLAYKTSPFYAPRPLARDVFIPTARYIDNDFFKEYKTAKDKLQSINKQEVIDNIIERFPYVGNVEKYNTVSGILEKLNFEAIYDLCNAQSKEQYQVLCETLEPEELVILNEFMEEAPGDFNILDFIDYMKKVMRDNDPRLFVSVAENEEDLTDEKRGIICSTDPNICEGLKVIYQNKIYDYSIYKTRKGGS